MSISQEQRAPTWIHRLTDPTTSIGRVFDRVIYSLILVSLIQFALETLPQAEPYSAWFLWSERATVAVFTLEYGLRTLSNRLTYTLSFFGVVDLLAILPFYVSFGLVDLRSIRVVRLLRLLRIAKLQRYGTAWRRLQAAFADIKEELIIYFSLTVVLVYLASVGIYYCEHDAQPETFRSVFHSMWWAVATLTTVGYGDVYPVTIAGKIFTFVVLILGLSVVAIPSGLIASALVKRPAANSEKRQS
jgi:voltage-gated potassium channel